MFPAGLISDYSGTSRGYVKLLIELKKLLKLSTGGEESVSRESTRVLAFTCGTTVAAAETVTILLLRQLAIRAASAP